eukprot:6816414-Pyramimonas_sp.AAC.1
MNEWETRRGRSSMSKTTGNERCGGSQIPRSALQHISLRDSHMKTSDNSEVSIRGDAGITQGRGEIYGE